MEILVENKDPEIASPFVKGRKVVIGVTFKGRIQLQDISPEERALLLIPKGAEATMVKVMNSKGEENVVEQMLITSALNLQLEKMVGAMPPRKIPITKTKTHYELECLGFELTDLSANFRKGYFELEQRYRIRDSPLESSFCVKFRESMTKGREKLKESAESIKSNFESLQTSANENAFAQEPEPAENVNQN
jgi:hypothetical protein